MTTTQPATSSGPYLRPKFVRFLATAILWVGVAWAVGGIAYAINGVTQTGAHVKITAVPTVQAGQQLTAVVEEMAGDTPDGPAIITTAADTELHLEVWNSTAPEQALSRGGGVLVGIAILAAGLLLRPLLLSLAEGEPFRAGNPRRIALLAAVVAAASFVSQLPRLAAANLVLERVGRTGGDLQLAAPDYELPIAGFLIPLGLLAVAEAFRRGSALADDTEGLV